MVNLIEFTLKSASGDRLIYLSPVNLSDLKMPSLLPPIKIYLFESLIKVNWRAQFRDNLPEMDKQCDNKELVIKHDQDFEKAYLGYLIFSNNEGEPWKYKDNFSTLNEQEIIELVTFMNNYKKGDNA